MFNFPIPLIEAHQARGIALHKRRLRNQLLRKVKVKVRFFHQDGIPFEIVMPV